MSWNGTPVIDLDSHIVERADRFYGDYLDPAYHDAYRELCDAPSPGRPRRATRTRSSAAAPRSSSRSRPGGPWGVATPSGSPGARPWRAGARRSRRDRVDALPPIRPEVSWDVKARVEDMDRALVDVSVLYPTHVSSYCALRDVGFENALYRAYHRWVADVLRAGADPAQVDGGRQHARRRGGRRGDPPLGGARPEPGRRLHLAAGPRRQAARQPGPLSRSTRSAQELDLPLLAHGGTARPPYGPGTFDLDGAWFLLHSFANPWAGMAALGALVGGGIFEMFPTLRVADHRDRRRLAAARAGSPGHALPHVAGPRPEPQAPAARGPGRGALLPRHRHLGALAPVLRAGARRGSLALRHRLAARRHARGRRACSRWWSRPGLTERAKRKILSENAMRLCPRLRA